MRDGKFILPIGRRLPLRNAPEAHALGEKGGAGKIVLLVQGQWGDMKSLGVPAGSGLSYHAGPILGALVCGVAGMKVSSPFVFQNDDSRLAESSCRTLFSHQGENRFHLTLRVIGNQKVKFSPGFKNHTILMGALQWSGPECSGQPHASI